MIPLHMHYTWHTGSMCCTCVLSKALPGRRIEVAYYFACLLVSSDMRDGIGQDVAASDILETAFRESIESSTNGLGLQAPGLPVVRGTYIRTIKPLILVGNLLLCSKSLGNPCAHSFTKHLQEVIMEFLCRQQDVDTLGPWRYFSGPRLAVFRQNVDLAYSISHA
jgi:hypothetical protein